MYVGYTLIYTSIELSSWRNATPIQQKNTGNIVMQEIWQAQTVSEIQILSVLANTKVKMENNLD